MANDRRDASERPRERHRDRDSQRDGRDSGRDRGNTPDDRRNRSRSPRRERGGRRDRYRSRSPIRREERGKARLDRDRDVDGYRSDRRHDRNDRGRGRGDRHSDREPPKGPRGAPAPRRGDYKAGGPVKPPSALRAEVRQDEGEDIKMEEEPRRERPEGMDDETWEVMQTMGFARFRSTKNTKVPGNDKNYGVRKDKQMVARQYMNRQGGFNRPLSPSRG